jgi:hypothetical protein
VTSTDMLFTPRSDGERVWWASASPAERLAYFLGVQRGMDYAWPSPPWMHRLRVRFGLEQPPAPEPTELAPSSAARPKRVVTHGEYRCRIEGCDAVATTAQGRAIHERSHESAVCDGCGRTFNLNGLGAHRRRWCTGTPSPEPGPGELTSPRWSDDPCTVCGEPVGELTGIGRPPTRCALHRNSGAGIRKGVA